MNNQTAEALLGSQFASEEKAATVADFLNGLRGVSYPEPGSWTVDVNGHGMFILSHVFSDETQP